MKIRKNNNNKVIQKLASSSLKASKIKNIFMTATIVLAICFIIVMAMSMLSYKNYERNIIKDMQDCIYYNITDEQAEKLASSDKVKSVTKMKTGTSKNLENYEIDPVWFDYNIKDINLYALSEGRYPIEYDEIVIDKYIAKNLGVEKIGDKINIFDEEFKVSGFTDNGKLISYAILFSEEYSKNGNLLKDVAFDGLIKVSENLNVPSSDYMKQLLYDLGTENGIERKYININDRFVDTFSLNSTQLTTVILLSISILIISGIVIYSIFYLSVTSRVKELGQLRTIGTTKNQLKKMIKIEALKHCKIGISLGIFLGGIISYFIQPQGFSLIVLGIVSIIVTIFGILTVLISVNKPAKIASKISPIEAIRYSGGTENIKSSKKLHRKLTPISLGKLQFNRNKKRTVITLVSLIIGGTLFITASVFVKSWDAELYARGGLFKNSEYNISFTEEAYENASNGIYDLAKNGNNLTKVKEELINLEEIEGIEELKEFSVNIEYNNEIIKDSIVSINEDDQDGLNACFEEGESNYKALVEKNEIFIANNNLAEEIYGWKFKVGDKIKIHYFDGEDKSKEFIIGGVGNTKGKDYISEYGSILIPEEIASEIIGDLDITTELRVSTKGNIYGEEIDNKVREIVDKYENLTLTTFTDYREVTKANVNSMTKTILGISGFIIIFSLINLINTTITSVISRKRELAVLQSIGMTEKQVKKMLIFENIYLAIPNCILSAFLGLGIGALIIEIIRLNGFKYMIFTVPILSIIGYILLSILVPSIISLVCIKIFKNDSIVDRLRNE